MKIRIASDAPPLCEAEVILRRPAELVVSGAAIVDNKTGEWLGPIVDLAFGPVRVTLALDPVHGLNAIADMAKALYQLHEQLVDERRAKMASKG